MSQRIPVNPGLVDWSGENPGIYLKEDPAGDYTALGIFFRIMLSPHGRGHTMIVLEKPDEAVGYPQANNICVTDNETLTNYLIDDFMSKFPSFQGRAALASMTRLPLDKVFYEGDMKHEYREVVRSGEIEVEMKWKNLQEPFAAEVTPKDSATKLHDMYSVFLEAKDASISVNGKAFSGQVVDRQFFGKTMSTAFLALSETWVTPSK